MERGHRLLRVAYVYPVLLLVLATASVALAYRSRFADPSACGRNVSLGCLDEAPYFVFEAIVLTLAAYLSYRAVRRTRKAKKDLWTARVYWPGVLVASGLLALVGYAFAAFPTRGCDAGAWTPVYVGYDCWDPGVTLLRVALAAFLTAAFMTAVTRVPGWTSRARPPKRREPAEAPDEGAVDEIPAQ